MFEGLKQKIRHKIAEAKEARAAYQEAKKEEHTRLQHLKMLKKLEFKKQRIQKAKELGVKSEHKTFLAKEKAKKAATKLKEAAAEAKKKADPFLDQMAERAKQYAKRELGFKRPRRRRKARKSRKRRY